MSEQIQDWRVSLTAGGDAAPSDGAGVVGPASVARLTTLTCDIYQLCLESLVRRLTKPLYRKIERPYGYLRLWADGYDVSSGELDKILADSTRLRHSTVRLLASLCRTLTNHLVPFVGEVADAGPLQLLSTQAKDLLETTSYSIHDGESSDSDSDSDNDSTPSFGELSIKDIAADLETDVQCLVDLGPGYEEPVRDRQPVEKEARPPGESTTWNPAEYLASIIRHRYPDGDSSLVTALGKNNWDRMLRLAKTREQKAQQAVEGSKEHKAATHASRSEFHDSGLGTSIATPSAYAETVISYHGSKGGSIKIPPLPAEAAGGKPFTCSICGDSVKITRLYFWKRHLLQDLQPYTCLVSSCKFSSTALPNKRTWIEHLKFGHGFPGSTLADLTCRFCQQVAWTDESALVAHMSRHLEEISLMIFHTNIGDDELEDSSDDESAHGSLLEEAPEAEPSDDDEDYRVKLSRGLAEVASGIAENVGKLHPDEPVSHSSAQAPEMDLATPDIVVEAHAIGHVSLARDQSLSPRWTSMPWTPSPLRDILRPPPLGAYEPTLPPSLEPQTLNADDSKSAPSAEDAIKVGIEGDIRLHGGIAVNGRPAELIRVFEDGKAISIATGQPVDLDEAPDEERMKWLARAETWWADEEDRLFACGKCGKEYERACDLTKHEKSHSRPHKCPVESCKYHEHGWPTETEAQRHFNDKHSADPKTFACLHQPCPYTSKRESNVRQHMEKSHGWPTETEAQRHFNDKHSADPKTFACLYQPCPYTSKREYNVRQHMEKSHGWTYRSHRPGGGASSSRTTGLPTPVSAEMLPQELLSGQDVSFTPIAHEQLPTPQTGGGMEPVNPMDIMPPSQENDLVSITSQNFADLTDDTYRYSH